MAQRFDIGDGWVEVSRGVEQAAFQISGEEQVAVGKAIAGLMSGEYEPADYDLVDEDDEAADEDE